jgi:hypothetical protein
VSQPPDPEGRRYFVGLDVGQAKDFTALAVLDRDPVSPDAPVQDRAPVYTLRHLQRFKLGTPYPAMAEHVARLVLRKPLPGCALVVDGTGVGRPFVDLLDAELRRQGAECRRAAVVISGGATPRRGGNGFLSVPKRDLIVTLQLLMQNRRLLVSKSLPDARALVKELEAYRLKVSLAGNETFDAHREGDHDDLVLAAALAAWVGEACIGKTPRPARALPTRVAGGGR